MVSDRYGFGWSIAMLLCAMGTLYCVNRALLLYTPAYSPDITLLNSPITSLGDVIGLATGFRKLAADVAWIQTLEYYGTDEANSDSEWVENGGGQYSLFLPYCERVALLDPHFTFVYYYGGGALGWNLNRLDQAESLIRLGIQNNPKESRLAQYLAALDYQKNRDSGKLMVFLASYVEQPDCPNLLRALLANLYKKQHRYQDAMKIWEMVEATGIPSDVHRAHEQLDILRNLAR